jgi:hypothetical protein
MGTDNEKVDKVKEISYFRRILPQILASSAKNLLLLDLGMAVSIPTIVIPALRGLKEHDNNDILSFTAAVIKLIATKTCCFYFYCDFYSKRHGLRQYLLFFNRSEALPVELSWSH